MPLAEEVEEIFIMVPRTLSHHQIIFLKFIRPFLAAIIINSSAAVNE